MLWEWKGGRGRKGMGYVGRNGCKGNMRKRLDVVNRVLLLMIVIFICNGSF